MQAETAGLRRMSGEQPWKVLQEVLLAPRRRLSDRSGKEGREEGRKGRWEERQN